MIEYETLKGCPYCASQSISICLKAKDLIGKQDGDFFLSKCAKCGLAFQNPRIKEKDIVDFYEPLGYFKSSQAIENKKNFWKSKTLANHFGYGRKNVFWFFTLPLKRILLAKSYPFFKGGGKLLEIGCSNGEFLAELNGLGWQTIGIEMSESSSRFAREKRGLEVINKKIEDCSFNSSEFDAIIMNMVLEHLYQPFEQLRKIATWLKPGGQLIFSIPNILGFEFRVFKEYAYGLQLPTHQTFFNKKILKECLKKMNFEKIKFYSQFFDRDIIASSQYKGGWFFKFLGYNRYIRLFFISPLVLFLSILGFTSRLTVFAQKQ